MIFYYSGYEKFLFYLNLRIFFVYLYTNYIMVIENILIIHLILIYLKNMDLK
jgi:hypothetical protein